MKSKKIPKFVYVTDKIISKLASGLGAFSALLILVIALIVTYNVGQRLTFGSGIPGMVDLSALALVFIAFGGAAQAELTENHVRMSILADRAGPKTRKVVLIGSQLIIATLTFIMIQATLDRAISSFLINESQATQKFLAIWPVRFFIVIGLIVLFLSSILKIIKEIFYPGSTVNQAVEGIEIVKAESEGKLNG